MYKYKYTEIKQRSRLKVQKKLLITNVGSPQFCIVSYK